MKKITSLISKFGILIIFFLVAISVYNIFHNDNYLKSPVRNTVSSNNGETMSSSAESESVFNEISSFSSDSLEIESFNDVEIKINCTFNTSDSLVYAWYIYSYYDRENPLEKIKYSNNPSLEYTFPDSKEKYAIKCFIRNPDTGEQKSAWVNNLYTATSIQDFNRSYICIAKASEDTYTLENTFLYSGDFETAWYVYDISDKTEVLSKQNYSKNTTFTFSLPDLKSRYAIKAFIKDTESEEKKSAWVAYLPLEEAAPIKDDLPEFTYSNIQREVMDSGYRFTNLYSNSDMEIGFYIYEENKGEKKLSGTIPGNTLLFENFDTDKNYILSAYAKKGKDIIKEVEFYYIYGEEAKKVYSFAIPRNSLSVSDILTENYKGIDISVPLSWELTDVSDRSTKNQIQSFRIFNNLLSDYISTQNPENAEIFLMYMEDFLDSYTTIPIEEDDGIWNDFSVSCRVRAFSAARILFDDFIDNELLKKMEDHLKQCASMLASEFYYKEKHNHGMYQDLALLVYLDAFGYLEEDISSIYDLAISRLQKYYSYAISDDGVLKEHSPDYHADIMESVYWTALYCELNGNSWSNEITALEKNMRGYYFNLIMPDFTWPALGDSYSSVKELEYLSSDPHYIWFQTRGKEGASPENTMAVYPDGGYAIMRSSWQDLPDKATYCILTAATHSTAHKHQDDLSFILYHKGALFTEAGKRNYNYADPETEYAYSSYAHNVLFIDGQGWPMSETGHPILDDNAYHTKIIDYGQNGSVMWATGRSERWPTVAQERTLQYDSDVNLVTITDLLTATQEENIRLIYHIADGVSIAQFEDGWELSHGEELLAKVSVSSSSAVTLHYLTENENQHEFKTWLFDEDHIETPLNGGLLIIDSVCVPGENSISLNIQLIE